MCSPHLYISAFNTTLLKMKLPKISIIGCGVSGLTVGIVLLRHGYSVEIITEKLPLQTTSAVAAAIWLPYEIKPIELANKWSNISHLTFQELVHQPTTGISIIPTKILLQKEEDAWWKTAIPKEFIRKALPNELSVDSTCGYVVQAPLIETPIYLKYLLDTFQDLGGTIDIDTIEDIITFTKEKEIVINCTGLGSRELLNDQSMYAIQGQIVQLQASDTVPCILAEYTFGEKGEDLAYVVPRKDCVILGGTLVKYGEDTRPKEVITKGIVERCQELVPAIKGLAVKNVVVGLRLGRPTLRLERIGNLIHNYGHGGGGFTVSWGCALEVLELVKEI